MAKVSGSGIPILSRKTGRATKLSDRHVLPTFKIVLVVSGSKMMSKSSAGRSESVRNAIKVVARRKVGQNDVIQSKSCEFAIESFAESQCNYANVNGIFTFGIWISKDF